VVDVAARPPPRLPPLADDLYLLAVLALLRALGPAPPALREGLGALIARVAHAFLPHRRETGRRVVRAVLGPRACPRSVAAIARESHVTFWQDQLTLCAGGGAGRVEAAGLEHLDGALARGRGAILWEHALFGRRVLAKLALRRRGYRVHQVHYWPHVEGFGREPDRQTALYRRWLRPAMQALERRLLAEVIAIPEGPSLAYLRLLRERLRANRVICVAANGHGGQRFVVAEALGRPLAISTGMPSLARATGAALLPLFCFRDHGGRLRLVIGPPLDAAREPEEEIVRRYAALFDALVRRYPGQFRGWLSLSLALLPRQAPPVGRGAAMTGG
jgi:KDO2-lipid IV(A) lauroyltransferase